MKSLKESYNSEIDLMYDYEKIFKKKGWNVEREKDKQNSLSAMNISIYKDKDDGQICFYIYCDWGVDGYGDYYSCQINDCSDVEYDYSAVKYKGFEVSGRGFLLFERNQKKFCDYLEQTLNELANLKVSVRENKKLKESNSIKTVNDFLMLCEEDEQLFSLYSETDSLENVTLDEIYRSHKEWLNMEIKGFYLYKREIVIEIKD